MKHHERLSNEDILHKKNLINLIHDGRFKVAIFGSARIQPTDPLYGEIRDFAEKLALKGHDIITGGGPGAMEAASLGHHLACQKDNPSQAIGINIELPFEQHPNKYLDITESTATFGVRLDTFVLLSHVYVITPGGIGTLLELFYTWQLMQVGHICRAPIIMWWAEFSLLKTYIHQLVEEGFINPTEAELAIQVDTPDQALDLIDMAYSAHEQMWENACVNINQYLAGARELGLI